MNADSGSLSTAPVPVPPTAIVGRDAERAAAARMLLDEGVRLLTVTGPPGVGKTRLALAVAQDVAHTLPACFVDLSFVAHAERVTHAVADQLGVRDAGARTPLEALVAHLRGQRLVLVLDNFEHVLEAAPAIAELLAQCHEVSIVVTSREPLRVRAEHELAVAPLDVPARGDVDDPARVSQAPAAALLLQRAQAIVPAFALTQANVRSIAEVCIELDGLPLALELAAGALRALSADELRSRLRHRLDFVLDGPRDLPPRQRTLRAAIGWSHGLLDEDARVLFRRLGIFRGRFTLAAANAVSSAAGQPTDVAPELSRLVQANLLGADAPIAGASRFRMLATIREFAAELLDASGERDAIGLAHARYHAALAGEAEPGLGGQQQTAWLSRLEADDADMRAALEFLVARGEAGSTGAIVRTLWRFWWVRGHLSDGRQLLQGLLERHGDAPALLRARLLATEGALAVWQADYAAARAALTAALAIARAHDDGDTAAFALTFLGRAARDQGDAPEAIFLGSEAVMLLRASGDRWELALALHFLGLASLRVDPGSAERCFDQSAAIFRACGDRWDLAMPLRGLGLVAYQRGEFTRALAQFEEARALFQDRGDDWSVAMVLHDLGCTLHAQRDQRRARTVLVESLRLWHRLGNTRGSITCLSALAGVAAAEGDWSAAGRLAGAAEVLGRAASIVLEPTDEPASPELAAPPSAAARRELEAGARQGRSMPLNEVVELALADPASSDDAPRRPGRLTAREQEVAALVRLGCSNRQIAETLSVSEGTAGLHVKHILAKLGFASRSQIAAWAVEQDLGSASHG